MVSNKWSAAIASPGTPKPCKVPPKPLPPPPPVPFPPGTIPVHWVASFPDYYGGTLSFDETFILPWDDYHSAWYLAELRAPFWFELGITIPPPYAVYSLTFRADSVDGFNQVDQLNDNVITPHPHDYHVTTFDYVDPAGSTDTADYTF